MTSGKVAVLPEGIYTPLPTFFKGPDYALDLDTQVKHALMLHAAGVHGVVVAGSMGESPHLTRSERLAITKAIRTAIPNTDFKIIAGLPTSCVQDAILEISAAAEVGADFAIVLPPLYFGPSLTLQKGLVDYFLTVADHLALPFVIYNYPGVANNLTLTPETFERLLEHPKIVGVKLTHFNLDQYTILTGNVKHNLRNNFRPFTGLGQILVPALSIGVFGAIDGLLGVFPKSMLQLYNLFKQGETKKAAELQYLVTQADQMIMDLNLVGVKFALKKLYGFGDIVAGRPPLNIATDPAVFAKYQPSFDALLEVERSL